MIYNFIRLMVFRRLTKSLLKSHLFNIIAARCLYWYLLLVYYTNRPLSISEDPQKIHDKYNPFIITFWHGRHIMGPLLRPQKEEIFAMFSKSKDAEINAMVGESLGLKLIRGSGGRGSDNARDKGGARALLALRSCLLNGASVSMIANVSHLQPREVGKGLITLAKISGRPVIPYVYSFSREIILHKTWDKTSIPLPFGRSVFLAGEPFWVDKDISDDDLDKKRLELTKIMDDLTDKADDLLHKNNLD